MRHGSLLLVALLVTPVRVSADMLRYTYVTPGNQILATVDLASPPALENVGWVAQATDVALWRVILQTSTGTRWVDALGPMALGSNFGTGIDSGGGFLVPDLNPVVEQVPSISVTMSPEFNQDRLVIDYGRGFGIVHMGNWVSPAVLATIPEPSPLSYAGILATLGGTMLACRRWMDSGHPSSGG
ncbi:MAG: hypothetical protein AB7I30_13020 [Isosphaeraceae bacterium]